MPPDEPPEPHEDGLLGSYEELGDGVGDESSDPQSLPLEPPLEPPELWLPHADSLSCLPVGPGDEELPEEGHLPLASLVTPPGQAPAADVSTFFGERPWQAVARKAVRPNAKMRRAMELLVR